MSDRPAHNEQSGRSALAARVLPASEPFDFDAVLLVGFGGPEGPDEVMPFLRRVTAGRGVPDARLQVVAEHYLHFGGVSPINAQTRELRQRIELALGSKNRSVPVYVANRNAAPLLDEVMPQLAARHSNVAVVLTSAFSSYSGCRQYRDDVTQAAAAFPHLVFRKPGPLCEQPLFVEAWVANIERTLAASDAPLDAAFDAIFYSAHSIPTSMAEGCAYEAQLRRVVEQLTQRVRHLPQLKTAEPRLVFQSRSGQAAVPWLEPDINDALRACAPDSRVLCVPIGFLTDHMEVVWDIDHEAQATASASQVELLRVETVALTSLGVATYVAALEDLRHGKTQGAYCGVTCCPAPVRPSSARPTVGGTG